MFWRCEETMATTDDELMKTVYKDPELIGEGGSGKVYRVKKKGVKHEIVVKRVVIEDNREVLRKQRLRLFKRKKKGNPADRTTVRPRTSFQRIERERKIWDEISKNNVSSHVLEMIDFQKRREVCWFEMPLVEWIMGDNTIHTIEDYSRAYNEINGFPLSIEIVKHIYGGAFLGIKELNRLGYIHRDVKPSNILITKNYVAQIADFDLAKKIPVDGETTDIKMKTIDLKANYDRTNPFAFGTEIFAPSEAWLPLKYNVTWDSWSLAMSMLDTKLNASPWCYEDQNLVPAQHGLSSTIGQEILSNYGRLEDGSRTEEQIGSYNLMACNIIQIYFDGERWPDARNEFNEFAKELMSFDIFKRRSVAEACEHPYMVEVVNGWEKNLEKMSIELADMIIEYTNNYQKGGF